MLVRFYEQIDNARIDAIEGALSEADGGSTMMVVIEAIHVGATRNYHRYSSQELQSALPTWTTPYERPVLVHHQATSGEPVGRVKEATFGPSVKMQGECITLKAVLLDPDVIAKVKDKRYSTVSVGGTAEKVICSICGVDRTENWCDHDRGKTYDGKVCYMDLQGITFDEISFVNVPADSVAGVVGMEESIQQESLGTSEAKAGDDPNRPKGKDGKPIGKMKTGNQKQAYYGHNLLHGYWRKGNTNWTRDQIKAEHTRVVRIILNKGWKHTMKDGLDDTLPDDLKNRSRAQKKS